MRVMPQGRSKQGGGASEIVAENRDRKEANEIFDKIERIFFKIQHQPEDFKKRYFELLQETGHDNKRSEREDRHSGGTDKDDCRVQETDRVDDGTTGSIIPKDRGAGGGERTAEKTDGSAYQEIEWRDFEGDIHRDIVPALPRDLAKPLDNEFAEETR